MNMEPTNAELQQQIDHLSKQLDEMQSAVLGSMNGADIEALAFLVLMAASKSAQGDLKAIMAEVNAMCKAKQELRQMMAKVLAIVLSATGPGATEKRAKLDEYRIKMLLSWLLA
jgi:hypothetical protein